jgi:hypothetical protein
VPDWGSTLLSAQRAANAGSVTSTSTGTTITNSGTAHTKGPWVQLLASAPFSASFLLITGAPSTAFSITIDIGIGPAASEYVLVPNLHFFGLTAGSITCFSFPTSIDLGQRVAARMQNGSAGGTLSLMLMLIGP